MLVKASIIYNIIFYYYRLQWQSKGQKPYTASWLLHSSKAYVLFHRSSHNMKVRRLRLEQVR